MNKAKVASAPVRLSYRIREVVAATGISQPVIERLIASGALPSARVGKIRLVRAVALDKFLAEREGHANAA